MKSIDEVKQKINSIRQACDRIATGKNLVAVGKDPMLTVVAGMGAVSGLMWVLDEGTPGFVEGDEESAT